MHGSGRGVTDALLESAGAEVVRLRCDRDVTFGGDSPPAPAAHLQELADRVTDPDSDVDMGIANDGDADRIAVVTPERGVLDANLFYAACYDRLLENDSGPAVRTVSTTFLVDRIAEAHGTGSVRDPGRLQVGRRGDGRARRAVRRRGVGRIHPPRPRPREGRRVDGAARRGGTRRRSRSTTGSIACSTSTGRSRPGRCRSTAPTTARWASSPTLRTTSPNQWPAMGSRKWSPSTALSSSWRTARGCSSALRARSRKTTGVREADSDAAVDKPARRGPRDRRAADLSARAIPPVAPSIGADVRQLSVPPCVRLEYI